MRTLLPGAAGEVGHRLTGVVELDVHVEDTATPDEVAAVEAAFRLAGFEVEVQPDHGRRSLGDLPWIVDVTLAAPIAAFFVAMATEAGKDAYAAIKA